MRRNSKSTGREKVEKEFAVIGLDYFGATLARRLEAMGHVVLGIDSELARVQAIADDISSAVALDVTNEDALQEIDIDSFSTVIVALGDDFEASALLVAYLKSLSIGRVICLAKSSRHRDILLRIGADQVILPEEDSGLRLAEILATPNMLERMLLDADHSVAELKIPNTLVGQAVSGLGRYDVIVLLIQRQGQLLPTPSGETRLEQNDTLLLVGQREKLLEVSSLP